MEGREETHGDTVGCYVGVNLTRSREKEEVALVPRGFKRPDLIRRDYGCISDGKAVSAMPVASDAKDVLTGGAYW